MKIRHTRNIRFTIAHFSCGCGGSAIGTMESRVDMGGYTARFENIGGVDIDPQQCKDYERLTGVPALEADLHTLNPVELRRYMPRAPDVLMSSPPCKGFSRLLGAKVAAQPKYQEMNMLLVDSLFLAVSTWNKPPGVIFFENVPGIKSRGERVIDIATQLLQANGYTVSMGNHDCGELGNLAQHRQRWFLIARHRDFVPRMIYHVVRRPVRACGEVIGPIPMPGMVDTCGPMHKVPKLSWLNWVKLSCIPAGGDWRDLPDVLKPGQKRREQWRRWPVNSWEEPSESVTGPGGSNVGAVADPRVRGMNGGALGVRGWDQAARTVTGEGYPSNGSNSVADPRWRNGTLGVVGFDEATGTITGSASTDNGRFAVADPRVAAALELYRYVDRADAVDSLNRTDGQRAPDYIPLIIAADETWHRPFTTLELAALQSFPLTVRGYPLVLDGSSHTRWREAIGNAVPPAAAKEIGNQILRALLAAFIGAPALATGGVWTEEHEEQPPLIEMSFAV